MRIISGLGVISFFYFAKPFLIPILLSMILFYLLDPLAVKAKKLKISRSISVPALLLLSVGVLSGLGWVTIVTTRQIAAQLPHYSNKIKKVVSIASEKANSVAHQTSVLIPHQQPKGRIQKVEVVKGYEQWTGVVLKGLDSVFGAIGLTSIVLLLGGLILYEKDSLSHTIFKSMPWYQMQLIELNHSLSRLVQRFFLGNLLFGIGSSVAFFFVFLAIGLENKFALSIGAGFLNIIPIVGTFLSVILPFAQAMLQYDSIAPFILIFAASTAIHFVFGNFVLPKVIGKTLDLNTVAATFGLLFWGWLWGPIGVFLAVPLTGVIKIAFGLRKDTVFISQILSQSAKKISPIILATSWKMPLTSEKSRARGIKIESL